MSKIRETIFYTEVLKEINVPYGDFYFFDGFIVSEISEGVIFTWEEAKPMIDEVVSFYGGDGSDLIYLSNRINKYSVKALDWLQFATFSFKLKGYGVISYSQSNIINSKLESLFVKSKFKTFSSIMEALQWAAELNNNVKI